MSPWLASPVRHALDVALAALALIVTSPVLGLAALAVRLETHGHAVFRQRRVGRDGVAFDLYKLRSMVAGAEGMGSGLAVDQGDSRITRVGRFLRRYSIDELPQLINVLRGEMSLVGPRPHLPCEVACYTERQWARLSVLPGLVCLREVGGRSRIGFEQWIELDLHYIERRSLRADLAILLRVIPALLRAEGAY